MATKENILTPEFRVSFPFLFRPQKPMQAGQDPKYSVVMLFPPGADLSALQKAALDAITEKYGTDREKWPKLKTPFRDQGEKTQEGYVKGAIFITATSKLKPGLVDAQVNPILDETQFYAGCYAKATVRVFLYETKGENGGVLNRGVSFGLQNVQKTRDGESLSSRVAPEKEFEPIADAGEAGDQGDAQDAANFFGT